MLSYEFEKLKNLSKSDLLMKYEFLDKEKKSYESKYREYKLMLDESDKLFNAYVVITPLVIAIICFSLFIALLVILV